MTDATVKPEFQLGDRVFYADASACAQIEVTCPLCYGDRFVRVILGNGDVQPIACSACGLGYEGPRGFIRERAPHSYVAAGEITGVSKEHFGWRYEADGIGRTWIFRTEAEAEAKRVELHEAAARDAQDVNESIAREKKKGLAWSVRYHQECIRRIETQLLYHRERLMMSKEKAAARKAGVIA